MNMKIRKGLSIFLGLTVLCIGSLANAETASFIARVDQILITETNFGGCMAAPATNPQNVLAACKAGWLTMSCDGSHFSKSHAKALLEQAQIALALDKRVRLHIDDSRRNNGYCLLYRMDLIRNN